MEKRPALFDTIHIQTILHGGMLIQLGLLGSDLLSDVFVTHIW